MTLSLDEFVQSASSGLFLPPRARINPIPYADLSALNPSLDQPQISPDLISALSVLVGQGPTQPKLIKSSSFGDLHVAARFGWVVRTVADWPAGTTSVTVDDTSLVHASDTLQVTFGPINAQQTFGTYFVTGEPTNNVLQLSNSNAFDVPIGSILSQLPGVVVSSFGNTFKIDPTDNRVTLDVNDGGTNRTDIRTFLAAASLIGFNASIANGASANILGGVAGHQVYVYFIRMGTNLGAGNGGSAFDVRETSASFLLGHGNNSSSGATPNGNTPDALTIIGSGAWNTLPSGAGINVVNVTGGGVANQYYGAAALTQI